MNLSQQLAAISRHAELLAAAKEVIHRDNTRRYNLKKAQVTAFAKSRHQINRENVLAVLTSEWVTGPSVAALAGCVRSAAYHMLVELEGEGIVERVGTDNRTKWRLIDEK